LCEFDGVERKIFTSCQVNFFTGKGHIFMGLKFLFNLMDEMVP
jgi:hypothetical protein